MAISISRRICFPLKQQFSEKTSELGLSIFVLKFKRYLMSFWIHLQLRFLISILEKILFDLNEPQLSFIKATSPLNFLMISQKILDMNKCSFIIDNLKFNCRWLTHWIIEASPNHYSFVKEVCSISPQIK